MNAEEAQEIWNMSDEELIDELTRPTDDQVYKLYLNSIALSRILKEMADRKSTRTYDNESESWEGE